MEQIEEWLLTTSIVYFLNENFLGKNLIFEIVNYFYKIGVPDIVIIDEFGNNPELFTKNKYFRYFSKENPIQVDDIIKNQDQYCHMNNVVIIMNNGIHYSSGYVNKVYLENIIYNINKIFQSDDKYVGVD